MEADKFECRKVHKNLDFASVQLYARTDEPQIGLTQLRNCSSSRRRKTIVWVGLILQPLPVSEAEIWVFMS